MASYSSYQPPHLADYMSYFDDKKFPSPSPTPSPRRPEYFHPPSPRGPEYYNSPSPVRPATRAHFHGQSTAGFSNNYPTPTPRGPSFSPRYTSDGQYATASTNGGVSYFDRENRGGFVVPPPYEPDRNLPRSHTRRNATSVPQRPQTARPASPNTYKRSAPEYILRATEADDKWHRIPRYFVEDWDPIEEPEPVRLTVRDLLLPTRSQPNNPKRGGSSSRNPSSPNGSTTRAFSSGKEEWYVEGYVHKIPVEGFPDNGADVSFISPQLATNLGLTPDNEEQHNIELPNGRSIISPGVVRLPWVFKGESTSSTIPCWIFPGLIHDLVLGKPFLALSETLTKFKHRIKSRLKAISRLRLMLVGHEQQRLYGLLNGQPTLALPDTGSDIMLVSRKYAQTHGLRVDWGKENHLEVEYADGSTEWTSGVARDVQWTVGSSTIVCDFHVLDNLCVDVVLSNDYLYHMEVFSAHAEHLGELVSEEDRIFFCTIRLVNNTSGQLETAQMVVDVTSPNAFGPSMTDQEWATRDRVRDEIAALPKDQQPTARQAEAERQRQWEELRKAHQLRWKSLPQTPVSSGQIPSNQSASSVGVSGKNLLIPSGQREKWRKRIKIPFLRRA